MHRPTNHLEILKLLINLYERKANSSNLSNYSC